MNGKNGSSSRELPLSAGVRLAPGVYFLAGLLTGFAADLKFRLLPALPRWVQLPGGGLLVAGCALLLAGLWPLHKAGTPINPMKRTTVLVTGGIFRFTRNPAYLGLISGYAGVALLGRCGSALLLLPAVAILIRIYAIRREEVYLARVFGEKYDEYRRKTRRWL